jgi:hypothetical protein
VSHSREQIAFPPAVAHSLMRRYGRKPHNLFYFWIAAKAVSSHCFFSIREAASATMLAGDMQAMTGVSEMAQKLISVCEDAMTTTSCAN